MVYHSSVSEDIEAFDKNKINANETDAYYNGFWFSTDPETSPAWRASKRVYPVFINLRNPITRKQAHKIAREYFKNEEFYDSIGSEGIRSGADAVRAKLQQLGYDGVIDFAHPKIIVQEFKETGQTTFETSGGTKYVIMQESDGVNVYEYDYYSDNHIGEINTSVDTIEELFNDAYFFGDETFVVFEPNQIKSATENVGAFSKENDDIRFSIDGGNKGNTEARGKKRYSKTEFKEVFSIPDTTLSALLNASVVSDDKSNLYGWNDYFYRQIYADNKEQIDNLAKGNGLDGQSFITEVSNPYKNIDYALPVDYFTLQNSLENLSETERQQILDERFPQIAAARENNRKWSEVQRKVNRANIENRKAIAKNVRGYFDSHILDYASVAYQNELSKIDNHISTWQAQGKSIPQAFYKKRGNVIKEFLDKIGTIPVVMATRGNILEQMQAKGCSDVQVQYVEESLVNGAEIPAFHINGNIFFIADDVTNIEDARNSYVHERQHVFTDRDRINNLNAVLSRAGSMEQIYDVVIALSDDPEYYSKLGKAEITDEFISFAMALSYTNANFADELNKAGVNEQLIEYINEYSRSQWQKADLSKSRRRGKTYSHVRVDKGGNSPQDVRNTISRPSQMGQQGLGSVQDSQGRTGERKYYKSRVGTVRGWTKDGVIYLTKDGLNPDTPIHEYTHIWADAVQKFNPTLWMLSIISKIQ